MTVRRFSARGSVRRPSSRSWRTASGFVIITAFVLLLAGPAFGADGVIVKLPNGDGPHCASNGTATRVFLAVRTKDAIDPGSIRVVSGVWSQSGVVGATNSWLLRLKGPRPVPPSTVQVVTSEGTTSFDVPGFDAPCPVSPAPAITGAVGDTAGGTPAGLEAVHTVTPAVVRASGDSAPISGSLPFTGMGTIQLLPIGAFCLCVGTLLLLGPRRPPRREALRYDGRFLS